MESYKRGGRRKKVKVLQKAAQNVTVNVKNIMRNDRTMIYPDMYKKQMDQSQNVGRQNLLSGPPLQYASPPQVIYMPHPNVGKQAILDTVNIGTNPNQNQRRIAIEDNNIAQPIITPVNPNDITQRKPDYRMVPSENVLPAFNIAGNMGVTPSLPSFPLMEGPIPHTHSAGLDMQPIMPSMRAEPSQPSIAGMSSQLFGGIERYYSGDTPSPPDSNRESPMPFQEEAGHSMSAFERYTKRGRPPKEAGDPKSPYQRRTYGPPIPKEFRQ
jgi:hypothetical protein